MSTLDGGVAEHRPGQDPEGRSRPPGTAHARRQDGVAACAKLVVHGRQQRHRRDRQTRQAPASTARSITFAASRSRPAYETVTYTAGPQDAGARDRQAANEHDSSPGATRSGTTCDFVYPQRVRSGGKQHPRAADGRPVPLAADEAIGKTGLLGADKTFSGIPPDSPTPSTPSTRPGSSSGSTACTSRGIEETPRRSSSRRRASPAFPGLDANGLLDAATRYLVSAVAYGNADNENVIYAARGDFIIVRTGDTPTWDRAVPVRRPERRPRMDDNGRSSATS